MSSPDTRKDPGQIPDVHSQFLNPERAKDFLTQADILAKNNEFKRAIATLQEAYKYQPNNPEIRLLAARIHLRKGKPQDAERLLSTVHQHHPPTSESLLLRARCEWAQDKLDACESTLEEVFLFRRDDPQGLSLLADVHYRRMKYSEAIGIYERLLEKDRGNQNLLYSLALSYFQIKDLNETLYYCNQLMQGAPSRKAVVTLYAKALREKKRDFIRSKGRVSFIDRLRLLFQDPYTNEQIKIRSEMERKTQRASRQTYLDANTGALNFKAMTEYVPNYLMASKAKFFVGLMDVDFFKAFNDHYSHQVGDVVLRTLSQMGAVAFPQRFFRKGGEEFVWVMDSEEEEGLKKAKEFRERVEKYAASEANNLILNTQLKNRETGELYRIEKPITISVGLALYGEDGRNPGELIEAADKCLLKAKASGRNAVVYRGEVLDQGAKPPKPVLDGRD